MIGRRRRRQTSALGSSKERRSHDRSSETLQTSLAFIRSSEGLFAPQALFKAMAGSEAYLAAAAATLLDNDDDDDYVLAFCVSASRISCCGLRSCAVFVGQQPTLRSLRSARAANELLDSSSSSCLTSEHVAVSERGQRWTIERKREKMPINCHGSAGTVQLVKPELHQSTVSSILASL